MTRSLKAAIALTPVLPNKKSRYKVAKIKRFEARILNLFDYPVLVKRVSFSGKDEIETFAD